MLTLEHGTLPLHDELASRPGFTDHAQHGQSLGTLNELRQRAHCGFRRLALLESLMGNLSRVKRNAATNSQLMSYFPKEQSHPSRLGTMIAFVAEENHQISCP
jgi:hypothetical protein